MRHFNIWLLLSLSIWTFAKPEMSPNEFLGEDKLEANSTLEFDAGINRTGENTFVQVENEENSTNVYFLETEEVNESRSSFGQLSFDFNGSSMEQLDGFLQNNKERFINKATEISTSARESKESREVHTLTSEYIYEHSDQNSTKRKVIDSIAEIERNLFAKISNQKTFTCYLSRKLKAGYMCPIPGLESAINGYAQKDTKESSLKECNSRCEKFKACVSKNIEENNIEEQVLNQNLFTNGELVLDTNRRLITNSITFTLKISDLNESKLEEQRYRIRYAVDYKYKSSDDNWTAYFESKIHPVKDTKFSLNIVINKPIEKIRLKFYTIYEIDPFWVGKEYVLDSSKHDYLLKESRISYLTNKHWYCPVTQFVYPNETEAVQCPDGEVKYVSGLGATVQQVCVPLELSFNRDEEFGGYKSESMCTNTCYESEECITTYRQPDASSYNGYIPDNKYDLEVGCVDTPNNTACTKQKCEDIINQDIRPLEEKMWDNQDNIIVTVKNGVRQNNVARPKVNLSAEYGSNSNSEAKKNVFREEMKDVSYVNMIHNNTYNVSALKIKENYATQMAYEHNINDVTKQVGLKWLLKPESKDYDNGEIYNFYSIMAIDVIYHPLKAISNNQGTEYLSLDSKSRAIDRLFLLHTTTGWKVFRRIEYFRMFTKVNKNGESVQYNWSNSYRSVNDKNVKFVNGEFKLYSTSEKPSPFFSKEIISDQPYDRITVVDDLHATLNQIAGLYFKSQSQRSGREISKNFTGDYIETEAAKYYGFSAYGMYVKKSLAYTYKDILDKLSQSQYFDVFKKSTYGSSIKSDTLYSDERVKFYVHGTKNNISVHSTIIPDATEEGKRSFFYMFLYDSSK